MVDTTSGIDQAIKAVGSQQALAKKVKCTQQNVAHWKRQGFVPVKHLEKVEKASGVPRKKLINPAIAGLFDLSV